MQGYVVSEGGGSAPGELPRYFAYYTKDEMTSLFQASGFEELSSTIFPRKIYGDDIQMMWFGRAG